MVLEKLTGYQIFKEFGEFYLNRRFINYHIRKSPPRVTLLNHINPVHAPHPNSYSSILILYSHLCLGLFP
jgi:hypothetical protein